MVDRHIVVMPFGGGRTLPPSMVVTGQRDRNHGTVVTLVLPTGFQCEPGQFGSVSFPTQPGHLGIVSWMPAYPKAECVIGLEVRMASAAGESVSAEGLLADLRFVLQLVDTFARHFWKALIDFVERVPEKGGLEEIWEMPASHFYYLACSIFGAVGYFVARPAGHSGTNPALAFHRWLDQQALGAGPDAAQVLVIARGHHEVLNHLSMGW